MANGWLRKPKGLTPTPGLAPQAKRKFGISLRIARSRGRRTRTSVPARLATEGERCQKRAATRSWQSRRPRGKRSGRGAVRRAVPTVAGRADGGALSEVRSGREVELVRHEGTVNDAVFSPDAVWLVTASSDRTVRFWPLRLEELRAEAATRLGRNLTYDEWKSSFPMTLILGPSLRCPFIRVSATTPRKIQSNHRRSRLPDSHSAAFVRPANSNPGLRTLDVLSGRQRI